MSTSRLKGASSRVPMDQRNRHSSLPDLTQIITDDSAVHPLALSTSALVQQQFQRSAAVSSAELTNTDMPYPLNSPDIEEDDNTQEDSSAHMNALAITLPKISVVEDRQVVLLQDEIEQLKRQLKMKEELVQIKIDELEKARKKAEYADFVAHELRVCLQSGQGHVSDIDEEVAKAAELAPTSPIKRRLERIRNSSFSLAAALVDGEEVANNQLDMSKIQAGMMSSHAKPIFLHKFLSEIFQSFAPKAREKSLELNLTMAEKLLWIKSDKQALTRIFKNIISNSMKFTESGYIEVSVVRQEQTENDLHSFVISIRDTGIGMTEAAAKKLFQEFSQVHDVQGKDYGGTGLGLSIAKQALESLKGTVNVTSAVGVGTTFALHFKFAIPTEEEKLHYLEAVESKGGVSLSTTPISTPNWSTASSRRRLSDEALTIPLRKLHILVADDNKVNRKILVKMLTSMGHEVVEAADGLEALAEYIKGPAVDGLEAISERIKVPAFDLIFMDIHMPNKDGLEATRDIRKLEAIKKGVVCPIVGLSGDAATEDKAQALGAGMSDYLTKPIHKPKISAMLETWTAKPTLLPLGDEEEAKLVQEAVLEQKETEQKKDKSERRVAIDDLFKSPEAAVQSEFFSRSPRSPQVQAGSLGLFGTVELEVVGPQPPLQLQHQTEPKPACCGPCTIM